MPRDIGLELAEAQKAYLEAPAGYGKTHAVALGVKQAFPLKGRQLILTHTHAGVHSLTGKLAKLSVPREAFTVETIAGWCLKYAASFKGVSKLEVLQPRREGWNSVYPAALECLKVPAILDVVLATYGGLFVDEYQDCTIAQHRVIMLLADRLPCRLLGDPLQGIFDFAGQCVDLSKDLSDFTALDPLETPYRWENAGSAELGAWLHEARKRFLKGESLTFDGPIQRIAVDRQSLNAKCLTTLALDGTILVAHQVDNQAHSFAKGIGGRMKSMEEMDCVDLMDFADSLDNGDNLSNTIALLEFILEATSHATANCNRFIHALRRDGRLDVGRYRSQRELATAIQSCVENGGPEHLLQVLELVLQINNVSIFRSELIGETKRCLKAMATGRHENYSSAAFAIRDMTRRLGRKSGRCISSRVLLVKGLEYDHVVVANAAGLKPKELYVALTRATKTLAIQADSDSLPTTSTRTTRSQTRTVVPQQDSLFEGLL